jgi:hypothetical protein
LTANKEAASLSCRIRWESHTLIANSARGHSDFDGKPANCGVFADKIGQGINDSGQAAKGKQCSRLAPRDEFPLAEREDYFTFYLRRTGFLADFLAFLGAFFFADFLTGFAAFDVAVERPPLKMFSQFSEYCFVAPMRTTLIAEDAPV